MEAMTLGRYLFGFCLFLSWLNSTVHVLQPQEMIYTRGTQIKFTSSAWKQLLPAWLIFVPACIIFSLAHWELASGIVILACIYWIRHWEISLWRERIVVDLGKYSPSGTCLFFYLIGYALAPYFDLNPQLVGLELACGVTASAWILSGWKKIEHSGLKWISSKTMGLMFAERAYIGHPILRSIRRYCLYHKSFLFLIAFMGVFLELLGVMFIFPDFRMYYAIIINILMIFTAFLLGYIEPEWMISIVALALMSK